MYLELLQTLGLPKNEAKIYETLLKEGMISVGRISIKSQIHRRNVYDSLNRLMEKGLVFEITRSKENLYQSVDPHKLEVLLTEKQKMLQESMPQLNALYKSTPYVDEVIIYQGAEGWKNYMQDIIKIGEDAYFIGAKGGWLNKRAKDFFPEFISQAKKRNIKFFHLFDYEVKTKVPEIFKYVGKNYKFLPKEYSSPAGVDVFGNHVNIISEINMGVLSEDISFKVIVNKNIADSFRQWFHFMWDMCS